MYRLGMLSLPIALSAGLAVGCGGGDGGTNDAGGDAGDAGTDSGDGGDGDGGTNGDGGTDAGEDAGDAGDGPCTGMAAGTECRPAEGACDLPEVCDGESDECPADVTAPDGTDCSESACEPATCTAGQCEEDADPACPVYVDSAGSDGDGCGSDWGSDACATPQGGSDEAVRAGVTRVFVKRETFTATGDTSLLSMAEELAYYGGFAGTEDVPSEREASARTTLDGDGKADHVVVGASNARLDGFLVTKGIGLMGAGMSNNGVSELVVENTDFEANVVTTTAPTDSAMGAAVYNSNSSALAFRHVSFTGNSLTVTGDEATAYGGAMSNSEATDVVLEDLNFEGNSAGGGPSAGGALFNEGSSVTLARVSFENNEATDGRDSLGGAVYNFETTLTATDVTFDANRAAGEFATGGAMSSAESTLELAAVAFTNNRTEATGDSAYGYGGAMYDNATVSSLTDVSFETNVGLNLFGGAYAWVGEPPSEMPAVEMDEVTFKDNVVEPGGGGGAYFESFSEEATPVTVRIENSRFEGNTAKDTDFAYGGGLYAGLAELTVADSLFVGNTVEDTGGVAGGGGGIALENTELGMTGVDLLDNSVVSEGFATGGGIDAYASDVIAANSSMGGNEIEGATTQGGALSIVAEETRNQTLTLQSVSVVDNRSQSGGSAGGIYSSPLVDLTIDNAVWGGNMPEDVILDGTNNTIGHVCAAEDPGDGADFTEFPGAFTDELEQDSDGRWYLKDGSVCIDSGDDDAADDAFGGDDWKSLTTQLDGTLDTGTVDHGRHYEP